MVCERDLIVCVFVTRVKNHPRCRWDENQTLMNLAITFASPVVGKSLSEWIPGVVRKQYCLVHNYVCVYFRSMKKQPFSEKQPSPPSSI